MNTYSLFDLNIIVSLENQMHSLKGPWHGIFDLWFFSSRGLKPFWIWLRICQHIRLWNRHFICSAVSMTPLLPKTILTHGHRCDQSILSYPNIFVCVKVIGIVQDNLPFLIDIPFKGSQSLSNMRPKDSAVSMTPLWPIPISYPNIFVCVC
jgi:hypothetical protein